MEGSSKTSYPTKRVFMFFPILLTLFISNLNASNDFPLTTFAELNKSLKYNAVPIFANTMATYNNLKSVNSKSVEPVKLLETTAAVVIAVEENKLEERHNLIKNAVSAVLSPAIMKNELRINIANTAQSYLGGSYKYVYGGTNPETGVDCSGFTRYVLNYFNVKISRSSDEQYESGTKIPVELARPGDLVFFSSGGGINHVAMVVSNDEKGFFVVHSTNRGIVKDNIKESDHWRSKMLSTAVNVIGF